MGPFQIDPLHDARWAELVESHPKASVFHTVGWLQALKRTYGYSPVVFTTSPSSAELENGVVFCHVRSWLTGDRMVSLPFSDHCEPLFDSGRDLRFVVQSMQNDREHRHWKYIEVRPANGSFYKEGSELGFQPAARYYLHRLDLRPELGQLFRGLHKDSVQRRVRRAENASIIHECGRSLKLLKHFYELLVTTRRRHHLPPQPYLWFQNLVDCMCDALEIHIAYQAQKPIAAILTLRFRNKAYYKYGGSDATFNHLGGMPFLLWKAIQKSKMANVQEFDFGRSDTDDRGLVTFKNHWGEGPTDLVYWRFPAAAARASRGTRRLDLAKRLFSCMPPRLLTATGRLIYRHMA